MEAQQKSTIESKSSQQRKLVRKNTLNRYLERSPPLSFGPGTGRRTTSPKLNRRTPIADFDFY
jgi:hypothetical protein